MQCEDCKREMHWESKSDSFVCQFCSRLPSALAEYLDRRQLKGKHGRKAGVQPKEEQTRKKPRKKPE